MLDRAGYEVGDDALHRDVEQPITGDSTVQAAIIAAYDDEGFANLCETLTDLDEGLQEWRYRHVMMVRRTIGTKPGTGGSDGAAYLATTLFRPAFPDLWAIRTGSRSDRVDTTQRCVSRNSVSLLEASGGVRRDAARCEPSTEAEIGRLPIATNNDLDDALTAAEAGFAVWRQTPPRDRADLIRHAAALMRERQDEIAHSITLEHGKPFQQARLEVIRGAEFFEWDAGEATRTYGRVIPSAPGVKYVVHHQPIGRWQRLL